jgi:uncharacterized RDD family membrane protein YckC
MDRNQAHERLRRASEMTERQEYAAARSELESILLSVTDEPEVYLQLGRVCVAMNDREEARYAFSRCLQLDPDHEEAAAAIADMDPDPRMGPPVPPSFEKVPRREIPLRGSHPPPAGPWVPQEPPHTQGWESAVAQPSPMGARVVAYFIDWVFILFASVPMVALFYLTLSLIPETREKMIPLFEDFIEDPSEQPAELLFLTSLPPLLVQAPLYAFFYFVSGQTPGKRLMGLRVVDAKTLGLLSFRQSVFRYLWLILGSLLQYAGAGFFLSTWVMLVGYGMAFMHPERKALHDFLAGTRVIASGPVPWQPGEKAMTVLLIILAPIGFGVLVLGMLALALVLGAL